MKISSQSKKLLVSFISIFLVLFCFLKVEASSVNDNYKTTDYKNYFQVISDDAVVYNNQGKQLTKMGTLVKGETYPIISDYGNWHRIQFGEQYGYVHKKYTVPGKKENIKNLNSNYKNSTEKFKPKETITVYDNSSGKLVPFAYLEKGLEYQIVSDYGNWYRVLVADRIGFVRKSEVSKLFTKNSRFFEVVKDDAPVYDNRSGSLVKVGTLEKGHVYARVSDYGNWHRIQYGDFYGYVRKADTIPSTGDRIPNPKGNYKNSSEKFVTNKNATIYDNSSGKLVPFARIEENVRFPIVSDYGNWYRVLIADRVGYIKKEDVIGYFGKNSKYFEVMEDNIPVYDNRQKGYLKKIGELKKGQVYERVSDYGNWHRIQFGDHYGYVNKKGTLPSFKKSLSNLNKNYSNSNYFFKTKQDINVYDNSKGYLVPFAEMKKGEEHPIVSDYGNWYRVLIANRIGYVRKSEVELIFNNNIKYFEVLESDLPIYDNRTGKLVKIGSLTKGQVYQRVNDYGNWHRIQFSDYYGYVRKSSTKPVLSKSFKNDMLSKYDIGSFKTKKEVIVYDNTGSSLKPFAKVSPGKTYKIIRDYGNWYEINLSGRYGYVRKNEVDTLRLMKPQNIVNPLQKYSYSDLRSDINQFAKAYPELISWKTIGKSVDGRYIYAIKLGKGKTEIFLNGAHHAREWLTTNLLMEMIDEYSQAYVKNTRIDGYNVREILNKTSIWFVPMVNPDGVMLVQEGAKTAKNPQQVIKINGGSSNFNSWKANIRGVDLNRQYPAGWDTILYNTGKPSPMNYKGKAPLTEPEAKAIYNFTLRHDFKTAVAYHSSGEVLYWDYKLSGKLKKTTRAIAEMIKSKTGYSLVFPGPNPSGGGYTDWFLLAQKKPGFTPEISPHVGPRPVPLSNFNSIWKKNYSIGLMLAEEAYINRFNR